MTDYAFGASAPAGCAVALGFFDGVHLGHREVISRAAAQKESGLVPVCFTFSKSPKSVLTGTELPLLMTRGDKLAAIKSLGVERVIEADFKSIMHLGAGEFFSEVLIKQLHAEKLFCGFNYRFGKNAEGGADELGRLCEKFGMTAETVSPVRVGGEIVSSTLIKKKIAQGEISLANKMLGSRFGFSAEVIHGKRLGHTLGTPTLNQLPPPALAEPRYGVYASVVTLEDGRRFSGVTNAGIKPTVGSNTAVWETWMPEYSGGDLYGSVADIRLTEFIRDEKRFDSLELLKEEIIRNARLAIKLNEGLL